MTQYNKPDWKERAKSLTENDFFVDFEEPTIEVDPPAVEPAEQLKTWICWYDNREIGTVQAYTREEAEELMIATFGAEYNFNSWDHDFGVSEADLEESVEKPDNAVVDCKVNNVIAHCEDEKPVDCKGEKKPLEKPLTEKN